MPAWAPCWARDSRLLRMGECPRSVHPGAIGTGWRGPAQDCMQLSLCACRAVGMDAFPRLEPPPPITKKRTPRALKTPQDMLIAPQPEGTSTRSGTEEPPEPPTAHPDPTEEQLGMGDPSPPECPGVPSMAGTLEPSGDQPASALPVPDLIHKGSRESQWQVGERATETSPTTEKPSRRPGLEHEPPGSTGRPEPRTPGWEVEGTHPDLLSFE